MRFDNPNDGGAVVTSTISATSGFEPARELRVDFNAAGSTALVMAYYGNVTYTGAGDVTGVGHIIGIHGKVFVNCPGHTVLLAIGAEGSIDNEDGTLTYGIGVVGALNTNAAGKTIDEFVGLLAQTNSQAGTVTKFVGVRSYVPSNSGTIGTMYAFEMPDIGGVPGITRKNCLKNYNIDAPIVTRSSVCDSSIQAYECTNGGTSNLVRDATFVLLNPSATIAGHTLLFPTNMEDGQSFEFFTTQTITTLTLNGNGNAIYGGPASLAAFGFFTMRYQSTIAGWVRVG